MKYQIKLDVVCKKTGIDLDDEYARLGFDKIYHNTPSKFPPKSLSIEVDTDFVRANRELFGDDHHASIKVDSVNTNPDHWLDYGSAGAMLNADTITAKWAVENAS